MQNIGDRLEEARKRQGISVREAAEATKVRSDFLINFENNNFDFDMPEVYKRGFLRLYSRFLKLDVDKMLTDYQAVVLGSSKHAKRENKEFFGRMDLPESSPTLGGEEAEPPLRSPHADSHRNPNDAPAQSIEYQTDTGIYWKIGLIVGGTVAVAVLLGVIISMLTGSPDSTDALNTDEPGIVSNEDGTTIIEDDLPMIEANTTPIIIRSSGTTQVLVRQESDKTLLFNEFMHAGQEQRIDRVGPVRVTSTDFHLLTIDVDGRVYKSPQEGMGFNIFE